ncbi:hypothetical protein NFI96_024127 [Prochilodus magdalenae]|nr:hypothetical protein NFI96_024127 [Prochilodus magdalenae]
MEVLEARQEEMWAWTFCRRFPGSKKLAKVKGGLALRPGGICSGKD